MSLTLHDRGIGSSVLSAERDRVTGGWTVTIAIPPVLQEGCSVTVAIEDCRPGLPPSGFAPLLSISNGTDQ